ncbi:nitroreductase family protein [Candidatus Woesearchaeota archaeon]|nr:nitroreductase family protein [Candidatus Woesearchaeota archaeon]
MDIFECIATRRSIRKFLDVPVDQETILSIVEAGTYAPSCGNVQDWRFIVVDSKDLMKTISEYSLGQECIHNAAILVVICSDPEQTERHYGLRGEKLYTIQNCAAATQNMLLAGHALGLGGVWIGAFDENKVRDILGIPSSVRPQAILAFGYPAEVPDEKIVKDLSLITFFNGYGARIKEVHRVLKDYHVDWERRVSEAHSAARRVQERAITVTKEASDQVKTASSRGEAIIRGYQKKLSEKLEETKKRLDKIEKKRKR